MYSKLRYWLPLAFAITCLTGLIYLTVQQVLRQSANDPQIQVAHDTADALAQGQPAPTLSSIELSKSQALFVMVFDKQGKIITSSAALNGQTPNLPVGVLKSSDTTGENKVTWQPASDVRIAAVAVPYSDGYVLAGRSLTVTEKRENQLTMALQLGWLVTMVGSFVVIILLIPSKK